MDGVECVYADLSVAVKAAGDASCSGPVVVGGPTGLLASVVTEESRTGSVRCPWLIRVESGQTVSLSLVDYGLSYTPGTAACTDVMALFLVEIFVNSENFDGN